MKRYGLILLLFAASICFAAGPVTAAETSAPASASAPKDVYAGKGMVTSAHKLASEAGVEILKKGGNAIDAAVATALALSVVEHHFSGIGGGGFATVRFAKTGEVVFVDYREMAPASAFKAMYEDKKIKETRARYTGVPGFAKGMFHLLDKYGTMKFADVVQPALRLAEEGWIVEPNQSHWYESMYLPFADKYTEAENSFFKDGLPYAVGQRMRLPNLAKTYRLLAEKGPDVVYNGEIGEALVKEVNRLGGVMTMDDMKKYTLLERKPSRGNYRGYAIFSSPPSSSGGTHVVQALNIMENFPANKWKVDDPTRLHVLAEIYRLVFADRQKYTADSDFVKVPLKGLTDKAYAKQLAAKINKNAAMKEVLPGDPWKYEPQAAAPKGALAVAGLGANTTHFSVADAAGNMVACTNTHNYPVGFVPGYDFMLNDEMDDFAKNADSVNAPEPGKRPLSSMSPTIVLTPDGKPFMTLGSAGGWRIITAVSQIIMNVIDYNMTMDQAIERQRIFTYAMDGKPAKLLMEGPVSDALKAALAKKGNEIDPRDKGDYFGTSQGILYKGGKLDGGADGRRLGEAVGL